MTRLWVTGERIALETDAAGVPRTFTWRGQAHPVESVANHWRVDTGWWALRVWREYWKLTTQTGLLVVVYRDFMTEQWYVQRLYD